MKNILYLVVPLLLSGCISQDFLLSLYVEPDGSADAVVSFDNVHSTSEEAEKKKEEERAWPEQFKSGTLTELKGLKANADRFEPTIIRDTPPFSGVARLHLSSVEKLTQAFDLKGQDRFEFKKDKKMRKLILHFGNEGKKEAEKSKDAKAEKKENDDPFFKIVPVNGEIVHLKGFTRKGNAAIFDSAEERRLKRTGKPYELFVEWTVSD